MWEMLVCVCVWRTLISSSLPAGIRSPPSSMGTIPQATDPFILRGGRFRLNGDSTRRRFHKVEEGPCSSIAIIRTEGSKK
jgi:hypothetical protein